MSQKSLTREQIDKITEEFFQDEQNEPFWTDGEKMAFKYILSSQGFEEVEKAPEAILSNFYNCALQKLKDGVECPHCKSRNIKYADTHHYANGHVTPIEVFICHDCGRSFPIEK